MTFFIVTVRVDPCPLFLQAAALSCTVNRVSRSRSTTRHPAGLQIGRAQLNTRTGAEACFGPLPLLPIRVIGQAAHFSAPPPNAIGSAAEE